jgi:hypothetical protein
MQFGDTVAVVNRTTKPLAAQWDGAHYHFAPGETPNVPIAIAVAAVKQNPLLGSEDPLGDPNIFTSLIGIKGARDPFGDCSPLEQSTAGERIDRTKVMGLGRKVKSLNAGSPTHFDARQGVENVNLQDDAERR